MEKEEKERGCERAACLVLEDECKIGAPGTFGMLQPDWFLGEGSCAKCLTIEGIAVC